MLQLALYNGLRLSGSGYEADPTQTVTGSLTRLNVITTQINGTYQKGTYGNIQNCVQDIIDATSGHTLGAIVAVGGLIIGKAAAQKLSSLSSTVPLATIIGRRNANVEAYSHSEGYYFDDDTTVTQTLKAKIDELLQYSGMTSTDGQNLWLLYNGNSEMGDAEKTAWSSILTGSPYNVASPHSINVAVDSQGRSVQNKDINIRSAFQTAKSGGAKAIVVSGDPYFTYRLQRIIRIAGAKNFSNLIMSYPVMEYSDEAKDAGMGSSNYFAYGPSLSDAYFNLGALVANQLKGTAPTTRFSQVTFTHS